MFPLSIIIPLGDSVPRFETTLASVLQNRPADCEIIAVHDGSYDDPYDLTGEVRFVQVHSATSLAQLLNAARQASTNDILHIVMDGVEVEDGWTAAAVARFGDASVASVSPLVVDATERDRLISAGLSLGFGGSRRVCLAGGKLRQRKVAKARSDGPTIEAAFYRREALAAINGFDQQTGSSLDVDVAQSLRAIGLTSVIEPDSRLHAEPRSGQRPHAFIEGRIAQRLVWRSAPRRGWLKSVLVQPLVIGGDLLRGLASPRKLTSLLGRAVACLEPIAYRRHYQMLNAARLHCRAAVESGQPDGSPEADDADTPIRRAA